MEYLRYYTVTMVRNMHLRSLRSLQSPMDSDMRLAVRSTPKAMDLQSVWYQQSPEIHLFHYQTCNTTEVRYSTVADRSVRREKVLKYVLDIPVCMVDVLDSAWASLWRASAVEDCSSLRVGVAWVWHGCNVCVCVCVGVWGGGGGGGGHECS